ncbi:MAG: beta-propeller domain-containing protein, partial [Candidatus Pacebacteria bacterium]|nr:beta-propeller domain-containing protein [Candidatus Paceibacterota bacterium]
MKDDFKLDSDHYYNINEFKEQKDSSGIKIKDFSLLFISIFALVFIGFGGVLLISKINNGGISSPVIESPVEEKDNGAVKKFNDYSEMQDFINEANVNIYGYSENYLGGVNVFEQRADFIMAESSDEIGTWGSVEAPAGVPMNGTFNNALKDIDYSTTNVQIAGVDEGDIVKTDGKYIYALSGSNVVIVNAYPVENSKEVSRIKLDSNPSGIYINNDRLLVYGQNYSYNTQEHKDIFPRNRFLTHSYLKVYDISDKNNPVEKKSYDLEGNLNSSRMIGDYVYFITSSPQFVYDEKFPVPIVIENGEVLSSEKTVVNCNCPDVYYFDIPYQSYNFTSISSLNIMQENGKLNSEVYLLDGYQNNLFVSENNAYITFNKRINKEELVMGIMMEMIKKYIFPEMSEKDREIISKIEKADEDIFSKTEKLGKIMMIISKYQNVFEDKGEDFEKDYKAEYENRIKEKFEDIS